MAMHMEAVIFVALTCTCAVVPVPYLNSLLAHSFSRCSPCHLLYHRNHRMPSEDVSSCLITTTRRRRRGVPIPRTRLATAALLLLFLACTYLVPAAATSTATTSHNKEQDGSHDDASTCRNDNHDDKASETPRFFSDSCRVVMAPSTLGPDAGWGIFVRGTDFKQGQAVLQGDVVIHLTDAEQGAAAVANDAAALAGLRRLLVDYAWEASVTGGFYEAPGRVVAIAPGVSMLANGLLKTSSSTRSAANAIPFVPTVDEGGQTRLSSPSAGAFTHYHNFTIFVQARDGLEAGSEVFVNYGPSWFEERQKGSQNLLTTTASPGSTRRSDEELRQYYCLDHVRPLARSVVQPVAGRGLQAARALPAHHVILPVPVLPLWQGPHMMRLLRQKQGDDKVEVHWQLLRNYVYAHPQSSLWLLPYGPFVNLINHYPEQANVRLQWSSKTATNDDATQKPWHEVSLQELLNAMAGTSSSNTTPPALLLELVTLRDIAPGEELFLDYGAAFQRTWQQHVEQWQPPPGAQQYAPAYVHDDAIQALRTQEELQDHPYPDNIFTSCFYDYNLTQHEQQQSATKDASSQHVVTVPWEPTRGVFELQHLRPCLVLRRENSQLTHQRKKEGTRFVVQIRNRLGLPTHAVIPTGHVHIVTRVPRHAIRFSDKMYTTDPHLPTAFRHEIHLPDDVFPETWKDLKERHSVIEDRDEEVI